MALLRHRRQRPTLTPIQCGRPPGSYRLSVRTRHRRASRCGTSGQPGPDEVAARAPRDRRPAPPDDRHSVGATANITAGQSQHLVSLPPGRAAVHTDGMDEAVLIQVPYAWARPRQGTARTPEHLIGRRSSTCGLDCLAVPCTLPEINSAYRLVGSTAWLSLWAELAMVGHLIGHPAPTLRPRHRSAFLGLPARHRDCALSQAIDDAVATRSAAFVCCGPVAGHGGRYPAGHGRAGGRAGSV